jgi:hypothetical protein
MAATVVTLLPPPQYDVLPPMPVIEHVLSREELQKACGAIDTKAIGHPQAAAARGEYYRGCSIRTVQYGVKVCEVWRIADDMVRRHELAHCAGWPGDHPGGH